MANISLAEATEALQACVDAARAGGAAPAVLARANYALTVMEFVAQNPDLYKQVRRVADYLPEVAAVMRAFPGAQIVEVRT